MLKQAFVVSLLFFVASAVASERVTGSFAAVRDCEAYKSFRKGQNPGYIRLAPGVTYQAIEVNKPNWEWVRVEVPDIDESQRWVAKECGIANIELEGAPAGGQAGAGCDEANTYDTNVLALTWQPGFCEHYHYQGTKPECDALQDGDLVIHHLTLHGLWPNKSVCGKYGYHDCSSISLDLTDDTVASLAPWMPNFIFEEKFGAYEWRKHGTCQALEDDEYFRLAQRLLEKVDKSAIGRFLAENVGGNVRVEAYRRDIVESLGQDVAERVQILCSGGRYLREIQVSLPKDIADTGSVSDMVAGAKPFESFSQQCDSMIHIERSGP